jgi:hypothetical protein
MTGSESPAATIRRAATLMRERAEAATRGPWEAEESDDCWQLFGAVTPHTHPLQLIKAPKHGTPYAEYWPHAADSAHIASWHPLVALIVADWLDAATRAAELTEASGAWLHPESHAFKVARAYLGEPVTA